MSYLLLTGSLAWGAVSIGSSALRQAVALMPELPVTDQIKPSRVELFLQAEIASREAPQVPVPRVITASVAPAMPVPVLAAALDKAESLPVAYSAKLRKLYMQARARNVEARQPEKVATLTKRKLHKSGAVPKLIIEAELFAFAGPVAKPKRTAGAKPAVRSESARDVTYRSLGAVAFAVP